MEPKLEVRNLSKVFEQSGKCFYALKDVSFCLYPGEILGIVGESGSGKSTAAKLITRLTDISEGEILLDGQEITHLTGKGLIPVYEKIQMVFQTPTGSFDPRRTLGDGITESLRNKGIPKTAAIEKARMLLQQCGLSEEFLNRYPHEVSGGQCQRAAIARSLMNDPHILVLDEATSALDVTVQKQIMELLQALQKEKNLSYLFICHNLALVQEFCSRVIVLYDGKIVEEGTPDEVICNPTSEYTKSLVNAVFSP